MEKKRKPEMIKEHIITDMGHGIINITAPPLRFQQYLILGETRAMLIDTGFGIGSMKKFTDELTNLPLILVNTHGHPDHSGGNAEFGSPYLHPADNEVYAVKCSYEARLDEAMDWELEHAADILQPTPPEPTPMENNQVFDLGGRTLTAILTPGHTRGSVCLLDSKTGYLFSGDTVQSTPTALLGAYATNVSEYLQTLEMLRNYPIRAICPGHRCSLLPADLIAKKITCAKLILDGNRGELINSREGPAYEVTLDSAAIRYSPENFG